jgi:two-component sensor histidine kinase
MDGFQLLRTLKNDPDLRSIPFLFYSATYTGEDEEKLALSLGADAFLIKPEEPEELWAKISSIIEGWESKREERTVRSEQLGSEEERLAEYGMIVARKLDKKVCELEEVLVRNKKTEEELRRVNMELTGEIAERQKAEAKLKASLAEKEILLKEIHHRVKNNMQIISSLLDLQFVNTLDEHALTALRSSQDRIKSMALAHEKLYQTNDLSRIEFAGYIESLTKHLCNSYLYDPDQVSFRIEVGDVKLPIDKSLPCGLIINELVSNSVKHAFPEGRKGLVTIRMHEDEDGTVTLAIADDGVGLPAGIDFRDTKSMGLQLVNILARQLQGQISMSGGRGTAFTITFKG